MMGIILISLFFSVLLEATLTTLPLTLIVILFLAVTVRKNEVFLIAFLEGVLLDILSFGTIGVSSLYFVSLVFVVFLYQKKFEIETLTFFAIFSFVGSLGYLFIEGTGYVILQSLFITAVTFLSFVVFKKFNKKAPKYA